MRFLSYSFVRAAVVGLAAWLLPAGAVFADIKAERIVTRLSRPVQLAAPPGDFERLFVIEQHTGRVRIIRNGAISGTFLTVGPLSTGNEQGLLGIAFHPDYAGNGRVYLSYTRSDATSEIAEYTVSANPDVANPASKRVVLTQSQPYSNHNGGQIHFGPDGYLYIGFGDGGDAGDPQNRAQTDSTWLGKILRIDVDGRDAGKAYAVPPSNPHVGPGNPLDEIWAKGLRNPWRFSFDRGTGDLYIADVGQENWEEVSYQPAGSAGGQNYGWRLMEGKHCYNPGTNCNPGGTLTLPIFEYRHNAGDGNPYGCPSALGGCSITGGFVYRGRRIPEIQGRYFFADYCSNRIHSFRVVNGAAADCQEHTAALSNAGTINRITSFGEDAYGELYICDVGGGGTEQGELYRIVRDVPLPDVDADGVPDASDNCPAASNPNQADGDDDGVGDACDSCAGTIPEIDVDANGCPPAARGDFDGDGDVDGADLEVLKACFTGPDLPLAEGCARADLEGDNDADQSDFGLFQACISGPDRPAPPACVSP